MVVSSVTKSENGAAIGCASIVVANLTFCGIIWPLEAVPYWIRWASILMPSTLPTEALRGLMSTGSIELIESITIKIESIFEFTIS